MIQNCLWKQGSTFSAWKSNRIDAKKEVVLSIQFHYPRQTTDPIGQSHIQINYNRLSLTYFSLHIIRWQGKQNRKPKMKLCANFTLYTLTSVCIISIQFSIHFQRCWLEEFVYQSTANLLTRCRVCGSVLEHWSANPKLWGSTPLEDSEFFLCPTRVKRRKTSFPNLELSWWSFSQSLWH